MAGESWFAWCVEAQNGCHAVRHPHTGGLMRYNVLVYWVHWVVTEYAFLYLPFLSLVTASNNYCMLIGVVIAKVPADRYTHTKMLRFIFRLQGGSFYSGSLNSFFLFFFFTFPEYCQELT